MGALNCRAVVALQRRALFGGGKATQAISSSADRRASFQAAAAKMALNRLPVIGLAT